MTDKTTFLLPQPERVLRVNKVRKTLTSLDAAFVEKVDDSLGGNIVLQHITHAGEPFNCARDDVDGYTGRAHPVAYFTFQVPGYTESPSGEAIEGAGAGLYRIAAELWGEDYVDEGAVEQASEDFLQAVQRLNYRDADLIIEDLAVAYNVGDGGLPDFYDHVAQLLVERAWGKRTTFDRYDRFRIKLPSKAQVQKMLRDREVRQEPWD